MGLGRLHSRRSTSRPMPPSLPGPSTASSSASTLTADELVADWDTDGDVDIDDSQNSSANTASPGTGSRYLIEGGDNNNSPPHFVSSTPADNATGVSPTTNITVTFDESVTKGVGNIEIVKTSDGSTVATISVTSANVTGSGTTWTIATGVTLANDTNYAVHIDSKTFKNADGAIFFGIQDNTTLQFTTAIGAVAPTITNVSPEQRVEHRAARAHHSSLGTHFVNGATVTVGGAAATNIMVTTNSITAITPAGMTGSRMRGWGPIPTQGYGHG